VRINFSQNEARVIGCLIEKQITTPDQYPLSLNALLAACNQKSNREPVLRLDERQVQETVDGLIGQRLVMERTGFGSRVAKFQHRFCNTEFQPLKFSDQELGIVCELLLRGPQTPGELRTRTHRLCRFDNAHEVESALSQLMQREDGPFVARLAREPGRREARYVHLFSGEVESVSESVDLGGVPAPAPVPAPDTQGVDVSARLTALESEVAALRSELGHMKRRLDESEREID